MSSRIKKIILLFGDVAVFHLALFLTLAVRYSSDRVADEWHIHWPIFLPIFILWLLLIFLAELYDLNLKATGQKFLTSLAQSSFLVGVISILYFYLNGDTRITPKTNLAIFFGLALVVFWLWRAIAQAAFKSLVQADKLAIIGTSLKSSRIENELAKNPGFGYLVDFKFERADQIAGIPEIIKNRGIHAVVVCDDFGQTENLSQALFSCLPFNVSFFDYPDFYESLTGKVPVEEIGPNWFLDNLREGRKHYFNSLKIFMDVILSLLIFAISLPFWPLIALGVKISSRGPVFFRQDRVGKEERIFQIIKFRTMREEANDAAPTAEGDPRITPFGSFLRRTRLDEIPQVINILRGEMSFIGPRPERPEIAAELEKNVPFYKTRLLIKPGLTGWDQVSGSYHSASTEDSLEKLQYDLYYLKRRSVYLDLKIVLKTLVTVVSRSGR